MSERFLYTIWNRLPFRFRQRLKQNVKRNMQEQLQSQNRNYIEGQSSFF